ncbi:C-X-C motif chemokine 11-1-like [Alosa pseudoharengus]|uniref:C-X-C motif chemokine 11-1-like n=1 Tax=Alosa pseudoharengus TaxID=34774 RepID=UPI003F891621
MKSAALVIMAFLLLVDVKAFRAPQGRCQCLNGLVDFIPRHNIAKLEIHPVSSSCTNLEIVVTLKANKGKKCLNPKAEYTEKVIKATIQRRHVQ